MLWYHGILVYRRSIQAQVLHMTVFSVCICHFGTLKLHGLHRLSVERAAPERQSQEATSYTEVGASSY